MNVTAADVVIITTTMTFITSKIKLEVLKLNTNLVMVQ